MIHELSRGTVLGLAAGLAPGPLLALVIAETLRSGVRSGIAVALAPLVTDPPIVLLSLLLLSGLSGAPAALGGLSLAGGAFVLWMGAGCLRAPRAETPHAGNSAASLSRGVLANVLSPHPYLFWISVGAPAVTRAWDLDRGAAAAFIAGFYLCLVGSKVALALLVGRSRALFSSAAYRLTLRLLGAALCLLALSLVRDGLVLLSLL